MTEYIILLLISAALTVLIEAVFFAFCFNDHLKPSLLVNLLTNPILNLILPGVCLGIELVFVPRLYLPALIAAILLLEVGVVLLEAFMYSVLTGKTVKQELPPSILANVISFVLGTGLLLFLS